MGTEPTQHIPAPRNVVSNGELILPNRGLEIERKFVVKDPPPHVLRAIPERVQQGYLSIGSNGSEVRVRKVTPAEEKGGSNNRYSMTIKAGSGIVRDETNIELTLEQFEKLWPQTEGRRLEKERRRIPYDGHCIELDTFSGSPQLMVAEVEFSSTEAAQSFAAPDWFGAEVTDNPLFRNSSLATSEGYDRVAVNEYRSSYLEREFSALAKQLQQWVLDDPLVMLVEDGANSVGECVTGTCTFLVGEEAVRREGDYIDAMMKVPRAAVYAPKILLEGNMVGVLKHISRLPESGRLEAAMSILVRHKDGEMLCNSPEWLNVAKILARSNGLDNQFYRGVCEDVLSLLNERPWDVASDD